MAVLPASAPFTLLVEEAGARLWGPEGGPIATLPEVPAGPERRRAWTEALRAHLPPRASVQLLLRHGDLSVLCQEVPFLSPKERREVGLRLASMEGDGSLPNVGVALDPDPQADGGHQLWVAVHPDREMREWLSALQGAGANLVHATAWQRALRVGLGEGPARDRLVLALETGHGHLLYYRGRGLVLQRSFRLPEGLDPAALEPETQEVLLEASLEEVSRTLQFIKQKHRGAAIAELELLGIPEAPAGLEERLARGLRLKLNVGEANLRALLLRGAAADLARKDGLTLVPQEVLEARKVGALRAAVWTAAALVLGLCALGLMFLARQERELEKDAVRAEQALVQRRAMVAEQDSAARRRFPLLRLRAAEARQGAALRQLASLAECLMDAPEGVRLERVEIAQVPGDELRHRFTIDGLALTRRSFSMGPLARYVEALSARPGLQLLPMKEVAVMDRQSGPDRAPDERALTRFTLEGSAP